MNCSCDIDNKFLSLTTRIKALLGTMKWIAKRIISELSWVVFPCFPLKLRIAVFRHLSLTFMTPFATGTLHYGFPLSLQSCLLRMEQFSSADVPRQLTDGACHCFLCGSSSIWRYFAERLKIKNVDSSLRMSVRLVFSNFFLMNL